MFFLGIIFSADIVNLEPLNVIGVRFNGPVLLRSADDVDRVRLMAPPLLYNLWPEDPGWGCECQTEDVD